MFLIQKISESFCVNKSVCSLFLDVSKAFDRVWHEGLIFKLYGIGAPIYLIKWIISFLDKRKFCVVINGSFSVFFIIKVGVPQGSVLSPLLFSVYINDIPKRDRSFMSYTLLFADDLVVFFIYNKPVNLQGIINNYLKELEPWLLSWKMCISPEKSSYMIFTRNKSKPLLNLNLFKRSLPQSNTIKFLGVTLDCRLTFKHYVDEIREKCNSRLNLIKIVSRKSWGLSISTMSTIYKSLIGSIID
ncbi:unnamed protein product [Brachionus calyciflorus]|uniref:Reverse transcriptase domain-containing protein n=1 Tax=Brachionus calyciflorus TaxID=104777 RepID=A0A813YUT8_9BILA|nr:unnamed protein product [Brachionus calyciflorus]